MGKLFQRGLATTDRDRFIAGQRFAVPVRERYEAARGAKFNSFTGRDNHFALGSAFRNDNRLRAAIIIGNLRGIGAAS